MSTLNPNLRIPLGVTNTDPIVAQLLAAKDIDDLSRQYRYILSDLANITLIAIQKNIKNWGYALVIRAAELMYANPQQACFIMNVTKRWMLSEERHRYLWSHFHAATKDAPTPAELDRSRGIVIVGIND